MRRNFILFFISLAMVMSQDLTGIRICIDPGHGGQESDDRYISATGFWESESNLTKGLELEKILKGLGADVKMTRTGNTDPPPTEAWGTPNDPSLSERVGIANNFNADYFNSIHSNGYSGTVNYTLTIYNGHTDEPRIPGSQTMAEILAPKIYEANRTTHYKAMGDLTLNPTWNYGYGVLYPANMPAIITEGSFHDYIPESWRLQNLDYRKNEARAIARAILVYFGKPGFNTGTLAGIVRDVDEAVDYYSLSGTGDNRKPVNNITVTITPGDIVYTGDSNNNGYFRVDSLTPGEYKVLVEAEGYKIDSKTITVIANKTVFADFNLVKEIPPPVVLFSLLPNYPNPFTPVTTIPFSLASDSDVRIRIFNLKGEEVALVFLGHLKAGYHSTNWDASQFPAGVYITRVEAGMNISSRKLTVLK